MNDKKNRTGGISTADIVHCGMFASLMAVGAFIKIMIPIGIWEVTFSLQFFFALLAGFLLGSKRGLAAVGVYLLIGLAGVPVFAHGGGLMYLMKPTFGFLIGFAAAAYVAGKIAEIMPGSGYFKLLFAAFWGEMAQRCRHRLCRADICVVSVNSHSGFHPVRAGGRSGAAAAPCDPEGELV